MNKLYDYFHDNYPDDTVKLEDNVLTTPDFIITKDISNYSYTITHLPENNIIECVDRRNLLQHLDLAECFNCGKILSENGDDTHISDIDGNYYCDNCYYDIFTHCADCCCELERGACNTYMDEDNDYCEDCYYNSHFCCDACENDYSNEDMHCVYEEDGNNGRFCSQCIENYMRDGTIFQCPDCNEYIYTETSLDPSHQYCRNCMNNHPHKTASKLKVYNSVLCYHPGIPITPIDNKKHLYKKDISKFKGYGIELEIDKDDNNILYNTNRNDNPAIETINKYIGGHCYFSNDCSLHNGFEIVTQPHTKNAMLSMNWKDTLKGLNDLGYAKDSKYAGYHIHISKTFFGNTDKTKEDNYAKLIYFFEHNKKALEKISRRSQEGLRWCKFYTGNTIAVNNNRLCKQYKIKYKRTPGWNDSYYVDVSEIPNDNMCKFIAKNKSYNRGAVNLSPKNTVEIRLFRSTLDYESFRATFEFVSTIVDNIKYITWKNINDNSKWLANLPETCKKYLKKYNVFGGDN